MPQRDAAPIGAPCWIDLFTSDPDASRTFYDTLFGWSSESAGEEYGGYVNFSKDGLPVAGCMRNDGQLLGEGVPAHWSISFGVADTDAALARAIELGGSVVTTPEDTPYGRLATAADPTGALFKLVAGS